jgi:histidinol-phosphatase (PHP family)
MIETMGDFVQAIQEAKERWAKEGITLRLGLEADYFPGGEDELKQILSTYEWDFVIGSVHFIYGWGGMIHRFIIEGNRENRKTEANGDKNG